MYVVLNRPAAFILRLVITLLFDFFVLSNVNDSAVSLLFFYKGLCYIFIMKLNYLVSKYFPLASNGNNLSVSFLFFTSCFDKRTLFVRIFVNFSQ